MSDKPSLSRALRHRSFVALWLANMVSTFGNALHGLALTWWVLAKTGSGLAMGTVMLCTLIPMVPFLLLGGALSDRWNRARILLVSDIARAGLSGLVAILIATDRLEVWHLYIIAVAFGTFAALFAPAVSAIMPQLVPQEDRPSANALRSLTNQMSMVLGPMVAAVILAVGQPALAFAIDSGTFVFSGLCMISLLKKSATPPRTEATSVIADIREGLAYTKREPWLWISIVAFFFINVANAPVYGIVLPYVVMKVQGYGASAMGIIDALSAVGSVGVAVWFGRKSKLRRRGWAVYGWVIVSGLIGMALGLPVSIYIIAGLTVLGGAANTALVLAWINLMQDRVPDDQFGRVSSIDQAGAVITIPIGMALFGWSLDQMDAMYVAALCGAIVMLAGALSLVHPKIREID